MKHDLPSTRSGCSCSILGLLSILLAGCEGDVRDPAAEHRQLVSDEGYSFEQLEQRNVQQFTLRIDSAPRLPLEMTEVIPRPPADDWELGEVSSAAIGADGLLYVLHRNPDIDPVVVLDVDGNVIDSWGAGLYTIPHSIRIDADGNVWTVDAGSSQIYKFTPSGEQLMHIDVGEMPETVSDFRGTADIAFAPDGNLFIADGYGNARVLEYTPDGERIGEWGAFGVDPGQFVVVHAIAVDSNDIVYVADRENGRIQRFSRDGTLLGVWDGVGRAFSLELHDGFLYAGVVRRGHPNRVAGWVLQLNTRTGVTEGVFALYWPHSLAIGEDGEIVVGSAPNKLLRYRRYSTN